MKKVPHLTERDNAFQLEREMPRFRTWYNFELTEKDKEAVSDEVVTIPGEALTVRQILERYTKGYPVDTREHEPVFTNTDDFDDYDPLLQPDRDMVDIQERIEYHKQNAKREAQAKQASKKEGMKGEKKEKPDITEAEGKKEDLGKELATNRQDDLKP